MSDVSSRYDCSSCKKEIVSVLAQCAVCTELYLCSKCRLNKVEVDSHTRNHRYKIIFLETQPLPNLDLISQREAPISKSKKSDPTTINESSRTIAIPDEPTSENLKATVYRLLDNLPISPMILHSLSFKCKVACILSMSRKPVHGLPDMMNWRQQSTEKKIEVRYEDLAEILFRSRNSVAKDGSKNTPIINQVSLFKNSAALRSFEDQFDKKLIPKWKLMNYVNLNKISEFLIDPERQLWQYITDDPPEKAKTSK